MVIVYIETGKGKLKKSAREAASFAAALAKSRNEEVVAVAAGNMPVEDLPTLGAYGITRVFEVVDARLNTTYSKACTRILSEIAGKLNAGTIVMMHDAAGKTIAPRLAVKMQAALLPGISGLPDAEGRYHKVVFSGKAIAALQTGKEMQVITLNPNSWKPGSGSGSAEVERTEIALSDSDFDYSLLSVEDESGGHVPLPEAEIVVSGGRGLKGPENWGIIEDLAAALNAATACSRPVSDADWRPHHEHVGQTGLTIKPNLYIAVGISGAIQHLAGVNQSKTIVVINKDPEAPFFKAADYGIVGDCFDVVPRLTEAVKKFRSSESG